MNKFLHTPVIEPAVQFPCVCSCLLVGKMIMESPLQSLQTLQTCSKPWLKIYLFCKVCNGNDVVRVIF